MTASKSAVLLASQRYTSTLALLLMPRRDSINYAEFYDKIAASRSALNRHAMTCTKSPI